MGPARLAAGGATQARTAGGAGGKLERIANGLVRASGAGVHIDSVHDGRVKAGEGSGGLGAEGELVDRAGQPILSIAAVAN